MTLGVKAKMMKLGIKIVKKISGIIFKIFTNFNQNLDVNVSQPISNT